MGRLLAAVYHPLMRRAEARTLGPWRSEVLAGVTGTVLEIGAGTGANLRHYPRHGLARLLLAEPDRHMRARLTARARTTPAIERVEIEVLDAFAERLPLPDASVDHVVATLVLCSVGDLDHAVAELHRVLRPGGTLRLVEHVAAADSSRLLRWQRRLEPAWSWCADGCRLTRRPLDALRRAGFATDGVRPAELRPAPPWVRPAVRGIAVRG